MKRVLVLVATVALSQVAAAQGVAVLQRQASTPAQEKAERAQTMRLEILRQELGENQAELVAEQAKKTPNSDNIERLQTNITLLNKEIEHAIKTPVPVITHAAIREQTRGRINPAEAGANNPSQAGDETEPTKAFESWDIFHNFGNKEPQQ